MEIYLVRHTRVNNYQNICYGHCEIPLADSFREEVESLKPLLPIYAGYYFSSPSARCLQLSLELNVMPVVDARLKEMNFGDWEGREWNDLPAKELDPWMKDFVNNAPPGGESLKDLFARVQQFVADNLSGKKGPAVILTHAGVIRCFYALVGQVELKDIFTVKVDHGSVHRLVAG
jgi:alpha-ribazole phosphatase